MRPTLKTIIIRLLIFIGALLVTVLIIGALSAVAHEPPELEGQLEELRARLPDSPELSLVIADLLKRHPWYYLPAPETDEDAPDGAEPAPRPPSTAPSGVERWRGLVAAHFAPGDVDTALCLMWHESRGNPDAKNPNSSAAGLFQILDFWWDAYGGDRYLPADNVAMAARIKREQGWSAWSPYKRGLCR